MKVALLILSDKGSRGEREDLSGPALTEWLNTRDATVIQTLLLPDEPAQISDQLVAWADDGDSDLIITCGGTGVSPRDRTPEATADIADLIIPGFGELMRQSSLKVTPHATLSRGQAAVRGSTLIINLPGSPRAATENLAAVWPAVPHAIAKIQGDPADCGGQA